MITPPAPPAVIGGRYRVLSTLGRGGFGVVYLVEHVNTGDRLALKVLYGAASRDPTSLERFKREARASAKVRSDNVVKIVDADAAPELDGAPYLVMELLDGQDLEHLVEARGALPASEVVQLLAQAARALDKAHALGIVHRDLKPENLFLHRREDGTQILKVLDFGIAKSLADGAGDLRTAGMTGTGAVLGTPLFMAPEQARGLVGSISAATDVWAIGLIAYRMLTGGIYWSAETLADLLVQIVAADMAPPSSRSERLPAAFDEWFFRSCNREPSRRFASVGEQVVALAAALGVARPQITVSDAPAAAALSPSVSSSGIGATGVALTHTAPPPPTARSRRALGVVLALGALVVASATAFQFLQHNAPRPANSAGRPSQQVEPTASSGAARVRPSASAPTVSSELPPPTSSAIPPTSADKRPHKPPPSSLAAHTAERVPAPPLTHPAEQPRPPTPRPPGPTRFDPEAP
jgi:serine/threonine protein kinase